MKTASKHIFRVVIILMGILLLLSACKGKEQETASATPQIEEEVVETPQPEETEEPAPAQEGEAAEGVDQTGSGQIISITMAEMEEMLESGEPFLVSFVTINCPYCQDFHAMLVEYVQDHPITMYQVILDYEETSEAENREIIVSYFPEFNTVPGVFYVTDGENYSYLDTYHLGVGMEPFDAWVQENNMIP